ncbi:MAG: DUF6519 domain-containing protein [Methanoregula sp.]
MAKKVTGKKTVAGSAADKKPQSARKMARAGEPEIPVDRPLLPVNAGQLETTCGEFRGDCTRDTFEPAKHYSSVLMQQGRVQLDADWNEQADIVLHYLRAMARDIIGPFGGPDNGGFDIGISAANRDLTILKGHYYVDGILCENENTVAYSGQPHLPLLPSEKDDLGKFFKENIPFLVYLDVWERHITWFYDPKVREIALNGPDTATRSQVIWQVKVLAADNLPADKKIQDEFIKKILPAGCKDIQDFIRNTWSRFNFRTGTIPQLKVMAKTPDDPLSVCILQPGSRYRGPENQLYRVEIHAPGTACAAGTTSCATFKWSRDNSSVNYPVVSMTENTATLANLGRDDRSTIREGDILEIVDDFHSLRQEPGYLVRAGSVDRSGMKVTFAPDVIAPTTGSNVLLRRWDHREELLKDGKKLIDGGIPVEESAEAEAWTDLEDGIQIQFQPKGNYYQTGDYWLIPARTISGNVGWPWDETGFQPRPPHGIAHHYAPLGVAFRQNEEFSICSCRCVFNRPCGTAAFKKTGDG